MDATHMSLAAAQFCHENQIILYCLLENATHLLQPCEFGFFGPLKSSWKRQVKYQNSKAKVSLKGIFQVFSENVGKMS
ncbi:hypothetical protein DPMN_071343 [Dreissena polymorpha]|uniref:DDE-1 domain-containing protein n=1 Tax=Dreissena polymorpha TaxID=45954 RepID=A0A9D3Z6J1_DREPO|nr:hypothetical protein DPMN_071343 [Dreissena polymorpha]